MSTPPPSQGPDTHEGPPTAATESKQIRDQIEALRSQVAKNDVRWYRDPTTLLSTMAILVSVATFFISERDQTSQQIREKQQYLDSLLIDELGLQIDFSKTVTQIADPLNREQTSSLYNAKHMIYIEEAENLAAQLGSHATAAELTTLALGEATFSNFTKTEYYHKQAVNVATDPIAKAMGYRNLGQLYFAPTKLRDFELGRKAFQDAVDVMKSSGDDDYSKYTQGYTYESWGVSEFMNGFTSEGMQKLERARKYYNDMSPQLPLRQWALDSLNLRLPKTPQSPSPYRSAFER